MADQNRVFSLLLWVASAASAFAASAFLYLAFQPHDPAVAAVAPSVTAAVVAGGAASGTALLCVGLFWRCSRSLLRGAQQGELKYRTMVESSTNGIIVIGDAIEECNAQACRLWGREPGEIIGRTLADISPRRQPGGRESAQVAREHMAAALAGEPQFFPWRHLLNEGVPVDTDMSLKAIDLGGRKALLLIVRDVTEQRQVEEKLRERNEFIETVLENMPIGLTVLTVNDRTIRYMNRLAEEIVGWPLEIVNDHERFWSSAVPDEAYRKEVLGKLDDYLDRGDPSQMVWEVHLTKRSGETAVNLWTSIPMFERNLLIMTAQDFTEKRQAEEALRLSEMRRVQLQAELDLAASVQRNLLPVDPPGVTGCDIAAFCMPARQVGGDFYDWEEAAPGTVTIAFGDIMGKGMAAAILMATVRATLRAVTREHPPATAVALAEQALRHDLDSSESFVTLFVARLEVASGRMTYVDCGHGYLFVRRRDGTVEELLPRGLPLGISRSGEYQDGTCQIGDGDALIVYSDGLLEPELELDVDHAVLAERVSGAPDARKMVELLAAAVKPSASLPDDITILVLRREG